MGIEYLNRLIGEGAAPKLPDSDATPSIGDKRLVTAPDTPPAAVTAFDDVRNGHEWTIQPGAADYVVNYVAGLVETPGRVPFTLRTAANGGVPIVLYKENGVVRFKGGGGISVSSASAADLGDAAAAVNVAGKLLGKFVLNTTSTRLYFATGALATSPWRPFDDQSGISDITPA